MKTMKPLLFEDCAEAILCCPGLEDSIVQWTYTIDKKRVAREPSSDAWQYRLTPRREFRVFLLASSQYGRKHWEEKGTDLRTTALKAFEMIEVPPPELLR